ncbi:hypothetical protein [Hasllibacter sp. MH4015]|uniref:hypothetical protein n=1 Tax=Hasllibacter sp. MH4015 TaxID=2854029 RepID=UPI001CD32E4B|nr:hypothetical protein [Hasllibacter sp. MH4015]
MAQEAEPGGPDGPGQEPDPQPINLDWALRVLEGVIFCCLSALVLFWVGDRVRSLDFDPFVLTPCTGADCETYDGPSAARPYNQFTNILEPRRVTTFAHADLCRLVGDFVETYGAEADGVDLVLTLIVERGTIVLTPAEDGVLVASPGPANDTWDDVLRDALHFAPARGCHPINYRPVFWPLLFSWMLLMGLRFYRKSAGT